MYFLQGARTKDSGKSNSLLLEASTKTFESNEKSILSKPKSVTHYRALNNPNTSPISTENRGENQVVFIRTKHPSASRTHIPMPTLL